MAHLFACLAQKLAPAGKYQHRLVGTFLQLWATCPACPVCDGEEGTEGEEGGMEEKEGRKLAKSFGLPDLVNICSSYSPPSWKCRLCDWRKDRLSRQRHQDDQECGEWWSLCQAGCSKWEGKVLDLQGFDQRVLDQNGEERDEAAQNCCVWKSRMWSLGDSRILRI